jgi:hypothetical protein
MSISNVREQSRILSNQLEEYIRSIARPETQVELGLETRAYRCRDILLILAGSDKSQDVEHFRKLLKKHLDVGKCPRTRLT